METYSEDSSVYGTKFFSGETYICLFIKQIFKSLLNPIHSTAFARTRKVMHFRFMALTEKHSIFVYLASY